ncbi:hypothetical protein GPAL_0553 [Glaciecola pallidula DSM 14239 = ACAM 615]|uniref:Uncharacterized protein n=1 Tax=Brumicola pallidula DSM 14239 = ACAM 615 TaxID=1121922 RepID=K6ZES9_9ALTE|nr:hypothetical protein GPAL_0553 [Glaciecola pallidula DSM 14239 = ACAM 615]
MSEFFASLSVLAKISAFRDNLEVFVNRAVFMSIVRTTHVLSV